MRRRRLLVLLLLVLSQVVFAQSLVGTWKSDMWLLKIACFRLTFLDEATYEVQCILGKTTGTYTFTEDSITFTPIKVGMNAGSAGDTKIYYYTVASENELYLRAKGIKVKLKKAEP